MNCTNLHCQRFLYVKTFICLFNCLFLVFLVENDRDFDWYALCMYGFCIGTYFDLCFKYNNLTTSRCVFSSASLFAFKVVLNDFHWD